MLGSKITHLCKLKGVTLRAACQASGLKYSTLHAQIAHNREIPFSTIDKLSRALNVPLHFFSENQPLFQIGAEQDGKAQSPLHVALERAINDQTKSLRGQGRHISIDDVLDWLVYEDFILQNSDWVKDQVDLYHPLKDGEPMASVYHVGKNSLAAQFLDFSTKADMDEHYRGFDPDAMAQLRLSHVGITHHKYSVTDQYFVIDRDRGKITGSYRKLMAGVRDEKGSPFTLVFCRMIRLVQE